MCDVINKLRWSKRKKIAVLLIKFLKHIHNDVESKVSNFEFIILNRFDIGRRYIKTKLRYGSRGRILKIKNIGTNVNINITIIGKKS